MVDIVKARGFVVRALTPDRWQDLSVTCFFVQREWRRSGLTAALLAAAVDHARRRGASIVEGCPVEPRRGRMPDASAFTGPATVFRKAGFAEVARRSETRPVMRLRLR